MVRPASLLHGQIAISVLPVCICGRSGTVRVNIPGQTSTVVLRTRKVVGRDTRPVEDFIHKRGNIGVGGIHLKLQNLP